VAGNIFTSTEYPPDQTIFFHNENSHCTTWPAQIFFFCETSPQERGETPIVDCRRIFQNISQKTRNSFKNGIKYVRNFGPGIGFPWQKVFSVNSRADLEQYCRDNEMEVHWKDDKRLTISYVRSAVSKHPKTHDLLWFNHGMLFHPSTLPEQMRKMFGSFLREEDFPYYTCYADGSPFESAVIDEIRNAYLKECSKFLWRRGDVLMGDNMLIAHGREPFAGPRKIRVGMTGTVNRKLVLV
jgi:alpha-ketoglutarate-dependent taurine dioxygenase